jgi:hypothetical protein
VLNKNNANGKPKAKLSSAGKTGISLAYLEGLELSSTIIISSFVKKCNSPFFGIKKFEDS